MKLLRKEKNTHICYVTYEKTCPCCGRKFRAAYPANDIYLSQEARDMVLSNYKTHRLICTDTLSEIKYSA